MELLNRGQVCLVNLRTLGQFVRATVGGFAHQQFLDAVKSICFHDAQLVVQIKTEALELIINNLLSATIAGDAFAGEHLYVDHGALRALVNTQ